MKTIERRCGALECALGYHSLYTLVMKRAGVAVTPSLVITNVGTRPSSPDVLGVVMPEASIAFESKLPALKPGESHSVHCRFPEDFTNLLERLTIPFHTELHVEIGGTHVVDIRVTFLDPWRWSLAPEARKYAAAYVMPSEPEVLEFVAEASTFDVVTEVNRTNLRQRVEALYETLGAHTFDYERPRVESRNGHEYQSIRRAHEMLRLGSGQRNHANCLDLSLLMCSALEASNISSLLIFTGSPDDAPDHAFVGCWLTPNVRAKPFVETSELLREVDRGHLLVIEATGLCKDRFHRLSFDDAVDRAESLLRQSGEDCHALDIAVCRVSRPKVESLATAMEPVVRRAYFEADRYRQQMNAPQYEATHLLYGLCASGSDVWRELLEGCGSSPERLMTAIGGRRQPGPPVDRPRYTGNHRRFNQDAKNAASHRGGRELRASDLAWAVVQTQSGSLLNALARASISVSHLRAVLATRFPQQNITNTIPATLQDSAADPYLESIDMNGLDRRAPSDQSDQAGHASI